MSRVFSRSLYLFDHPKSFTHFNIKVDTMFNDNPPDKPITKQHVEQAASRWQAEPGLRGFREGTKYSVLIEGKPYPPKAIISIANELAGNGALYPTNFPGKFDGKWHKKLTDIGYEIVEKNDFLIDRLSAEDENTKDQLSRVMNASDLTDTQKLQLIMARIGQGDFRKAVIDRAGGQCDVTGVDVVEILVASHIQAWADCGSSKERLNPANGLLLTPNLDKLFDRGFISFSNEGEMVVKDKKWISNLLSHDSEWPYPSRSLRNKPNEEQQWFLEKHRRKFDFP